MTTLPHLTATVLFGLAVITGCGCAADNEQKPTALLRIEPPVSVLSDKWKPSLGATPCDDEAEKYVEQAVTLIRTPMILEDTAFRPMCAGFRMSKTKKM